MKQLLIKLGQFSAFSFLLIPISSLNHVVPTSLQPSRIEQPNLLFEASYKPQKSEIAAKVTFQTYHPPKIKVAPAANTNQVTPTAPVNLDELFSRYASQYGVSKEVLIKIAKCESGLNPHANSGTYVGLFQFASGTWSSNRKSMGLDPNPSLRTNAEESIKTAAFKISRDGTGAWPTCSR